MTKKEMLREHNEFKHALEDYALDHDLVNAVFYTAIRFIDELLERSFSHPDTLKLYTEWLTNGSTIKLKSALNMIGYVDEDLIDFNAFSMLDNVSCIRHT